MELLVGSRADGEPLAGVGAAMQGTQSLIYCMALFVYAELPTLLLTPLWLMSVCLVAERSLF